MRKDYYAYHENWGTEDWEDEISNNKANLKLPLFDEEKSSRQDCLHNYKYDSWGSGES